MTTTSPTAQCRQPVAAALLVDFGGVLTVPLERAFGALSVESGLDPRTALRLLATHEGPRTALGEHEVGQLDDEGFEDAFAAAIAEVGGRVEARGLLARLAHHLDLDELFDVTVISGQVGVRKPSRRIYAIAADRLGLAPEQCVMVDDLEHNLVGAARLGIRGIHHRTAADTVRAVREVLALPRPTPA